MKFILACVFIALSLFTPAYLDVQVRCFGYLKTSSFVYWWFGVMGGILAMKVLIWV